MGNEQKTKLIRNHHKVSRVKKARKKNVDPKTAKIVATTEVIKKGGRKRIATEKKGKASKHKTNELSPDDPLRAFYESLLEQNPGSSMAKKYCNDHGILKNELNSLSAVSKA